jgi:hypothetical protein
LGILGLTGPEIIYQEAWYQLGSCRGRKQRIDKTTSLQPNLASALAQFELEPGLRLLINVEEH